MTFKHKVPSDMECTEDASDSNNISSWGHDDSDLDELFLSPNTITLTSEQVDQLMDDFYAALSALQNTESQMVLSPPRNPKYLASENMTPPLALDSGTENDEEMILDIPRQLDRDALLKSTVGKSIIALYNNGVLSSVNLKDAILETSKILTIEDRQKLISELPSGDIINGDIRSDFFSDKNTVFWNQLKEFERHFFE